VQLATEASARKTQLGGQAALVAARLDDDALPAPREIQDERDDLAGFVLAHERPVDSQEARREAREPSQASIGPEVMRQLETLPGQTMRDPMTDIPLVDREQATTVSGVEGGGVLLGGQLYRLLGRPTVPRPWVTAISCWPIAG
jgi:hypothetical protein